MPRRTRKRTSRAMRRRRAMSREESILRLKEQSRRRNKLAAVRRMNERMRRTS